MYIYTTKRKDEFDMQWHGMMTCPLGKSERKTFGFL
jgi:hypothetical protein